jgi:hypothetical protein
MPTDLQVTMVETFQCPGCIIGSNIRCKSFKPSDNSLACSSHAAGTTIGPFVGNINLGLPKGFNRLGPIDRRIQGTNVRLWESIPEYDKFNIPTWAMEVNGYLFVRTYSPRINVTYVDIIHNGKIEDLPKSVVNVGNFIDEID